MARKHTTFGQSLVHVRAGFVGRGTGQPRGRTKYEVCEIFFEFPKVV